MSKVVAVAGVTGAVGQEMLRVLEKRNFPVRKLVPLASERSAGKKVTFKNEEITVDKLTKDSFKGVDIALFSAGGSVSKEFAPAAARSGSVVVDNSSAFRMDPDVPLVVPEVNAEDISKHKGIIANPNCSTIIMLVAVAPIHRVNPVKRIVVSTYQAVSGTGLKAIEELERQVRAWIDGARIEKNVYPHQIAFNLFPHVDVFLENGYSKEEMKMVNETRKMLHDEAITVTATTVRVPVFRAHSEAINLTLSRKMSPAEVRRIIAGAAGVRICDDPEKGAYPTPLMATGQDDVLVGRIRTDISQENGIDMFVSGDQILKGAALNAVQIAEKL